MARKKEFNAGVKFSFKKLFRASRGAFLPKGPTDNAVIKEFCESMQNLDYIDASNDKKNLKNDNSRLGKDFKKSVTAALTEYSM